MTDVSAVEPEPTEAPDEIRERLLRAAAKVFAQKGYEGTKIQTIVREAALSTGAVYGRFESKNDLLKEAVINRSLPRAGQGADGPERVADLVAKAASSLGRQLSDGEALLLEIYVTARREPEVAAALSDTDDRWRATVAPLVEAAIADGTIADEVDAEAVLFLVRTLRLGMLLQRGSGLPLPDPDAWSALVDRVIASFGRLPDTPSTTSEEDQR